MSIEDSTPTISVIIPVYNVLHYVQDAVDSILNQSEPPGEIIIVNDGSTDGSGELVESLYGEHPLVRIIHTENGGLGEARNTGTRAATGDYIYYFDSDDLCVDGLFAHFNQQITAQPDIEIFAFSAESFADPLTRDHAQHGKPARLSAYRRGIEQTFASGEEAFNVLTKRDAFIPNAWLYLFSRQVQVRQQLLFLPIIHEDEEFTPRLFFYAGKTCVTDKVYFRRRVRIGSIMQSSRTEKNAIGYLRACDALESLLIKASSPDSRQNLQSRIVRNILNVLGIKAQSVEPFSDQSRQDLARLIRQYSCPDIWLASKNYALWRVINFGLKKLKLRTA